MCSVLFRAIVFVVMAEVFDNELIELVKFLVGVIFGSQIKP